MSAGRDELHRALKIDDWDRRILRCHFLIRPVIDKVAGELLPVAHRVAAESAIAVIDQQRPGTGNLRCIGRRISGYFLHAFNRNCADLRALAYQNLSELYDIPANRRIGKGQRRILRIRAVPGQILEGPANFALGQKQTLSV